MPGVLKHRSSYDGFASFTAKAAALIFATVQAAVGGERGEKGGGGKGDGGGGKGGGGKGGGGSIGGHDVTPHPHPRSTSLSSVLAHTSGHTEFVEAQLQFSSDRVSSARHFAIVAMNHPILVETLPEDKHQFLSNPHPKSYPLQLSSSFFPLHASAEQSPFIEFRSS